MTNAHLLTPQSDFLRNAIRLGLVFLLLAIPYSTFLVRAVPFGFSQLGVDVTTSLQLALLAWKELLLVALVLLVIGVALRERRLPFRVNQLDWAIALFCLLVLVVGWRDELTPQQILFGLRVDISVFLYYWVARSVVSSVADLQRFLRLLILVGLPVWLLGVAQTLFLPQDFLNSFGYSWSSAVSGNALVPYHLIGDNLVRAMATFPSPNYLAQYGVLILLASLSFGPKLLGNRWLHWFLVTAVGLAVVLTFSRAHLIGLILGPLLVWVALAFRPRASGQPAAWHISWVGWLGLTLVATLATVWLGRISSQEQGAIGSLILHGASTTLHGEGITQVWEAIRAHPWGTGIGTAGPATANTVPLVVDPESITLQVALEYGWLGFLTFLGVIASVYRFGYQLIEQHRSFALFFLVSFSAMLISGIFLPSWFSWATITWWVLFGLFVSSFDHAARGVKK